MSRHGGTCVAAPTLERLGVLKELYHDNDYALAMIQKLDAMVQNPGDDALLREGIYMTVELLLEAKLEVQELRQRISNLEKLVASRKEDRLKLSVRQVLCNFNEKILRKAMQLLNIDEDTFWDVYSVGNFGAFEGHPALMAVWPKIRKQLGLDPRATPKALWEKLKLARKRLDKFVHAESFDKLPYEELKLAADRVFAGGNHDERCKKFFLQFLDLSTKIGGDLYVV